MLHTVLPNWFEWHRTIVAEQGRKIRSATAKCGKRWARELRIAPSMVFKATAPRVLPFVCINFNLEDDGTGQLAYIDCKINIHTSSFIATMKDCVNTYIEEYLRDDPADLRKAMVAEALVTMKGEHVIAFCPQVHDSIVLSHELSRPLVELKPAHLIEAKLARNGKEARSTSGVFAEFHNERKIFEKHYNELSEWMVWLRRCNLAGGE